MNLHNHANKFPASTFVRFFAGFFVFIVSVSLVFPQTQTPVLNWTKTVKIVNKKDTPAEKLIKVNSKVQVQFCVADGEVKINGWNRSEVRAFIDRGSPVDFKVRQMDKTTGDPVWIEIIGYDAGKKNVVNPEKCLSGKLIEIDVPHATAVLLKGRTSSTRINSARKVSIELAAGDVFLESIRDGIEATTYQGDITVGNSEGNMSLAGTTGNIVVYDVAPEETGDVFKAKTTSGAVSMQNVAHRQTEVHSTSGSVSFAGEISNSGQYNFGTQNGYILFSIPNNSSGKISASYGFGEFTSEIPLTNVVKSENSRAQSLTGIIGKGDANLNLTTFNGRIYIKKQ